MRIALFSLLVLGLTAGCDTGLGEAQRIFEDQAFLGAAEGITEIRLVDGGGVTDFTDPDDWRTGPIFGTRAMVLTPPTPNPVGVSEGFSILVDFDEPGQLELRVRNSAGDFPFRPGFEFQQPGGGFRTLTLTGGELSNGNPGLYRVVVLDALQRVVTYGDVRVGG